MNDIERDLRSLLRNKADEVGEPDVFPHAVLRRARLRRAVTASLLAMSLFVVGAGGLEASRALRSAGEWRPASPVERLVDVAELDEEMSPAGRVEVIAEGESEKGPFTYLGWPAEGDDVCLQFVVNGEAQQTSCFSPELPPGPLHLSASRSSGWDDRLIDGMVDPGVERLEARMSQGIRIDVPIHPGPPGLNADGRNFVVGFVPGALEGELVAFDARGQRVGSFALPYINEPDPADDPRLDEQVEKVTLAAGTLAGSNGVAWRYRAWRTPDGGLCTEVRLRGRAGPAFDEGQSQCLMPDQVDRLGDDVIAVERWLWHSGAAFVAGFASSEVEEIAAGPVGGPLYSGDADLRLMPLEEALGDDLSGFRFVTAWLPDRGPAEIIALGPAGAGDRRIGSAVVDAESPEVTTLTRGEMSFERCGRMGAPEIARAFRLFGSQPAKLAAMLEAVLAPTQMCSVGESAVTAPAKPKRLRRD
jgi:hypothetical protein